MKDTSPAKNNIEALKLVLAKDSVKEQFSNALAEGSNLFVASLIDLYASDTALQACDPNLVILEALKAATLKLPINRSLGFAYIIPYARSRKIDGQWRKEVIPQFQLGYRGYLQLAMRTGQYRYINADVVLDGELRRCDKLTGEIDLSGETVNGEVVGFFAHIETINGFRKTVFWSRARVEAHAKRYSKSYSNESSAWQTNFDEMAIKTVLRHLLGKYGVLSVDMVAAFTADNDTSVDASECLQREISAMANQGPLLDLPADDPGDCGPPPEHMPELGAAPDIEVEF